MSEASNLRSSILQCARLRSSARCCCCGAGRGIFFGRIVPRHGKLLLPPPPDMLLAHRCHLLWMECGQNITETWSPRSTLEILVESEAASRHALGVLILGIPGCSNSTERRAIYLEISEVVLFLACRLEYPQPGAPERTKG